MLSNSYVCRFAMQLLSFIESFCCNYWNVFVCTTVCVCNTKRNKERKTSRTVIHRVDLCTSITMCACWLNGLFAQNANRSVLFSFLSCCKFLVFIRFLYLFIFIVCLLCCCYFCCFCGFVDLFLSLSFEYFVFVRFVSSLEFK